MERALELQGSDITPQSGKLVVSIGISSVSVCGTFLVLNGMAIVLHSTADR